VLGAGYMLKKKRAAATALVAGVNQG